MGDRRQSAAALCRAHAEIGGFPEVVLKPIDGGGYLRTLLAAVIHKDIVSRFRLRAPQALDAVATCLLSNPGAEFSFASLGLLTAVENGGAETVSRRSKMAAHSRAGLWAGRIGATAPITPPFRERHRSALRHGDLERDSP